MKKVVQVEKRINHKENFELCYLRHQYLRQAKHIPTREEMAPYDKIVENFGNNTYYTYKNLFLMVGLDLEDVLNTTQVYLASYLGLFALERNPKKLADFKRSFRSNNYLICKKEDILDKNKANFTCFLKQRLQDLVRVCRQKAKNIRGLIPDEFIVFRGKKKPPFDIEDLLENHKKHGYSPLEVSIFKTIKKRANNIQEGPVYLFDSTWYVCVPIRKKILTLNDFVSNNFDPRDNLCNQNPEERLEKTEALEQFVLKNRDNSKEKENVGLALGFLKEHRRFEWKRQ